MRVEKINKQINISVSNVTLFSWSVLFNVPQRAGKYGFPPFIFLCGLDILGQMQQYRLLRLTCEYVEGSKVLNHILFPHFSSTDSIQHYHIAGIYHESFNFANFMKFK